MRVRTIACVFVLVVDNRLHATVFYLARYMLELNRRVIDAKFLAQPRLYFAKDAFTFRWRDIGDADVARQGMGAAPDTPDVQVMNVVHARDLGDGQSDLGNVDPPRSSFQEDVKRFANDAK